jgi:hypothetical protein
LLVIHLAAGYNWVADECDAPDPRARIEKELRKLLDRPVTLRFERAEDAGAGTNPPALSPPAQTPRRPGAPDAEPVVQKVVQLFEARPVHMEVEEEPEATR